MKWLRPMQSLHISEGNFSQEKKPECSWPFLFERFVKDKKTVDAVVRNLEIIGEAHNEI